MQNEGRRDNALYLKAIIELFTILICLVRSFRGEGRIIANKYAVMYVCIEESQDSIEQAGLNKLGVTQRKCNRK